MNDEQKAELAAIRARRDELRIAKEQREAVDALAVEKKFLEEEEIVSKFENEYGPVGRGIVVERCPGGELIIARKPHAATYNKFQDIEKPLTNDFRAFVVADGKQLLFPKNATELLDEYPAMVGRLAMALARL